MRGEHTPEPTAQWGGIAIFVAVCVCCVAVATTDCGRLSVSGAFGFAGKHQRCGHDFVAHAESIDLHFRLRIVDAVAGHGRRPL
jgi:hypothetical protein